MILDFLFPKSCVSCGAIGSYICKDCQKQIRFFDFSLCPVCDRPTENGRTHDVCRSPLGLDGFLSIVQYAEPISTLVHSVKYEGVRDAAAEMFELTKRRWPSYAPTFDVLLPIPMHPKKLRDRGYNQAALLAGKLSAFLHVPMSDRTLIKVRETVPQMSLKKEERKQNEALQQSFVCLYRNIVKGKRIGLVDDVATTRSTLKFACEAVKKAGAKEVWGIAFAHGY